MRKETFEKYNNKKAGEIHDNLGLASMTEDLDTSSSRRNLIWPFNH